MNKRILTMIAALAMLVTPAFGLQYMQMEFQDFWGEGVTGLTSVNVQDAGTATTSTLFSDRGGNTSLTNPIVSGLGQGRISFWINAASYKVTATDGSNTLVEDNITGSRSYIPWWSSYMAVQSGLSLTDAQALVFGTDTDWSAQSATATEMIWTPLVDNSKFDIGVSGTTLNSDFNVWVGTALGLKVDAGVPSFVWDGGAASLNASSNFATNINTGTSTGAINLGSSTAGAIAVDSTSTGSWNTDGATSITTTDAGADITVNSVLGRIIIEGEEDAADAVLITADGSTASTLRIFNDTGTGVSAATETDASVQLQSDVGGIGLNSALNAANAIRLEANGGTSEQIILHSNQGTSVTEGTASIQLLSDAGGIILESNANLAKSVQLIADAGATESIFIQSDQGTAASAATELDAAIQLVADVGGVGIRSGLNAANSIRLEADGGASEIVIVHSNQGTGASAATESDASIQLLSDVGGIGLRTSLNAADAIRLETDGGTSEQIILHSNQGTSVTEGTASIQLLSDAGGIILESNANLADAILLVTDGGTTETMTLHADLGTSVTETAASIQLLSDAGGISLVSTSNLAKAIQIVADGGTTETIFIQADQSTAVNAIDLVADVGGVTITAALPLKLEAALTLNDVQTIGQDDATPDVSGFSFFNTGTNADTIDDFDGTDIEEGQIIVVASKAAITYDIDAGALIAGTTDLVTASGDISIWIYDGTNWHLISWMDDAVDQNGRG